ncbi:MAG TPA: 50S ribosomal protein L1 [Tepidisphaeraceae bacterium]|jgi:large subunit ribosomal protein L1|nr:50S ribosomal protein L1 [Tepidisphaeraceae bacterium]
MAAVIVKRSKRYKQAATKAIPDALALEPAVELLKQFTPTKFDQSVEVIFSLGIDAKQADQMIRGSLSLPHGIGKSKRVVAFCPDHLVAAATEAGAIKAGGQTLVQEIERENFSDFDVAISTPDMMRFVGRLGKVLGPKGLMPSPKAGTVTADIATAVREYAAGKVEFRNDAGGNVHTVVGKLSFDNSKLVDNINAIIAQIRKMKPQTSKGAYIKKVVLKGSMTPAVYLNVQY